MSDDWKNNPRLSGMDPPEAFHASGSGRSGIGEKSVRTSAIFIMGAASKGKNAGLNFSSDEISTIIEVLKMGKSPAEALSLTEL